MNRLASIPALILLTTLLMSVFALAHGGLVHVLGTVVEITEHSISVKVADGSIKTVAFDAETHFLKGASPATAKDLVVGSRVVIHAHQHGEKFHAAEVKIAAGVAAKRHP
ncbi:MAG: hypothetical protein ACRD3B_18350 [Candidatus Sulfotelmatobacter sp.]